MVAGGHLIDATGLATYSLTVKGISIRLLHAIAHANGLKVLCGDVGNAFVNAHTREKVYFIARLKFGRLAGRQVTVVKALYGLKSLSKQCHAHFADNLQALGFTPEI